MRACQALLPGSVLAFLVAPALADEAPVAADLPLLEKRWHKCVRQAFQDSWISVPKRSAEMAALAECKPAEDAYVAAVLASQSAEAEARRQNGEGLRAKARALAASVLSLCPRSCPE